MKPANFPAGFAPLSTSDGFFHLAPQPQSLAQPPQYLIYPSGTYSESPLTMRGPASTHSTTGYLYSTASDFSKTMARLPQPAAPQVEPPQLFSRVLNSVTGWRPMPSNMAVTPNFPSVDSRTAAEISFEEFSNHPQAQLPPWPRACIKTNDRIFRSALDTWYSTGIFDMTTVMACVSGTADRDIQFTNLLRLFHFVDEILSEQSINTISHREIESGQVTHSDSMKILEKLVDETTKIFLTITRYSSVSKKQEPKRMEVVRQYCHLAHHRPMLLKYFDTRSKTDYRYKLDKCRLRKKIEMLMYMEEKKIRLYDKEIDQLVELDIQTMGSPEVEISAILNKRPYACSFQSGLIRQTPSSARTPSSSESRTSFASSSTTSESRGITDRQGKKRRNSKLDAGENRIRAKRHRVDSDDGQAPLVLPQNSPSPEPDEIDQWLMPFPAEILSTSHPVDQEQHETQFAVGHAAWDSTTAPSATAVDITATRLGSVQDTTAAEGEIAGEVDFYEDLFWND